MAKIALPLYLDEGQYGDDPVRIRRPDGSCLCESAESDIDEMREVLTAINGHAALQAQVAALEAERDRLHGQVQRILAKAVMWESVYHVVSPLGPLYGAGIEDTAKGCAHVIRAIVGDGDEEVQS